jgi:hypothetical protein
MKLLGIIGMNFGIIDEPLIRYLHLSDTGKIKETVMGQYISYLQILRSLVTQERSVLQYSH